jgi:hypothetical protein
MALIRDKYQLHIINDMISVVGYLRDLIYIYKYREIITFDMNNSCHCSRGMIP